MHQKKMMLTIWMSPIENANYWILETKQILTNDVYCNQRDEVYIQFSKMRPALINRRGLILQGYHCKCCKDVTGKVHRIWRRDFTHPSYSSDGPTTDNHFFKHPENSLKQNRFSCKEDTETLFKYFSASEDFYSKARNILLSRWQKYVDVQRPYFGRFKRCLNILVQK